MVQAALEVGKHFKLAEGFSHSLPQWGAVLLFLLVLNMTANLVRSGVSTCTSAGKHIRPAGGGAGCRRRWQSAACPAALGLARARLHSLSRFLHSLSRFRASPQAGPKPLLSPARRGGRGAAPGRLQRSRRGRGADKASAGLPNAGLRRRLLRHFKSRGEVTGQSSPRLGCGWEGGILLTARVSVYLIATWLHVPVEEGCRSQANL